jgi:hypothetical protein
MRQNRRIQEEETYEVDLAVNFYDYLAERVPSDAHFLINRYGSYRKARTPKEMSSQLKDFVNKYKGNALKELATIHPDRELILASAQANPPQNNAMFYNANGDNEFLNGCGCSGSASADGGDGCGCTYQRGMDGMLTKDKSKCSIHGTQYQNFTDGSKDYATLFIVGVVALLGGLYFGSKGK